MRYRVTAHLSTDFRRTSDLAYGFAGALRSGDSFDKAASEGVYDGEGFTVTLSADSHLAAAEKMYAICNSYPATEVAGKAYPAELHCGAEFIDEVVRYRKAGNRSLSMGDMVVVEGGHTDDGRYICASFGFKPLSDMDADNRNKLTRIGAEAPNGNNP